jgi:hypothetical protein
MQFCLANIPVQAILDVEPVLITDSRGERIYSEMSTGYWWLDKQDHLPTGATIVPVIPASDTTHLDNPSDDQHDWLQYLTIGNNEKDISRTSKKSTCLLDGLIPCPLEGAKKIHNALRSTIGTVLSQPWLLDISGLGLKRDRAEGFQPQWYLLLASWVGDYPEKVTVTYV